MVSLDFDQAASYALERLKTPEIKLKSEKVKATRHVYGGKDVFVAFPTGFGLPCMFDYRKQGVVGSSLALVISPCIRTSSNE